MTTQRATPLEPTPTPDPYVPSEQVRLEVEILESEAAQAEQAAAEQAPPEPPQTLERQAASRASLGQGLGMLVLLAGLLGLLAAAPARAQLVVDTTADTDDGECAVDCSLREAIDVATSGQTITFAAALDGQTITLGGSQLLIDKDLTIDTEGRAVTVDADGLSRVFQIGTEDAGRQVTLRGLTITGGEAEEVTDDSGVFKVAGGIFVERLNTLRLEGATVRGNHAEFGGGIWAQGILEMTHSTISGNSAIFGGGISVHRRRTLNKVTNSTISGNSANQGAGIASHFGGATITATTITGNAATVNGGGVWGAGDGFHLSSSIVAGNTAAASADCWSDVRALGHNLFSSGGGCRGTPSDQFVDLADVFTTVLEPTLADNGGPTQTHRLLPGSPALDTGACNGLATDQRGLPREVDIVYKADTGGDACDVGAVEATQDEADLIVDTTLDEQDGSCALTDDCSLRDAIALAISGQTITFAAALDGQTITLGGSQLLIDKDLTINTEGRAVTVDADGLSRVFQIGTEDAGRQVTLRGLTITGGVGEVVSDDDTIGGGIFVERLNTLRLEEATVRGNRAKGGGGIWAQGILEMTHSTISGNSAIFGGGISVHRRRTLNKVTNSTISGNSANQGAGIASHFGGATITATTITGNAATVNGGGVWGAGDGFHLSSSIVAGNTAAASADCWSDVRALGHNLFSSGGGCRGTPSDQFVDLADVFTTVLEPTLADNGGPTQTHRLLPGSPALDTGACNGLATDQRGLPREVDIVYKADTGGDACDVGAVEATQDEAALPTVRLDDPSANEADGMITFTVTLSRLSHLDALIDYQTSDGTATEPDDYTATTGQLTIPAGALTGTIDIPVIDDTVDDDDETFTLALTDATNATLDDAEGTATIEDNDTTDLALTKDDGDLTARPGAVIAYTLTVTNAGNNPAPGVVLTETVPDHTTFDASNSDAAWTCADGDPAGTNCTLDVGTLAPSASENATFAVVVVNPLPAAVTETSNTASVADDGSNGPDATPDDNTATDTTPLEAEPDLTLAKDDGAITAIPGQVIDYTLTVTNTGDQDATGVVLTETVPEHATFDAANSDASWSCSDGDPAGTACTFSVGDLAGGGGTASVSFAVVVDKPLAAGIDQIDNTASVQDDNANGDDPTPEDNTASDTTPVTASAMISATLSDDLVTDPDGDGTADPGDTLEYTATVSNTGDQDAADVIYTQTVDAHTSLNCATVDPGAGALTDCTGGPGGALTVDLTTVAGERRLFKRQATATITFRATVNTPLLSTVTTISTQGSLAFTGEDGPEAVVTDDPETTPLGDETATLIDQSADLNLSKTVDTATPDYHSEVVFTLRVTNDGPTESASATVEDALPEGLVYISHTGEGFFDPDTNTWTTPSISFESTAEIAITVRVETVEPVTNTACITEARFPDPHESDNCAAASITPVASDLALTKTLASFSGDPATNTITATFTLRVTNDGPTDATGVIVDDPLPEGAALVSATGTGNYSAATGLWTVGALSKDATATLAMVMTADASHNLVNVAKASADQPDHNPGNNVSAAQAQHDPAAPERFTADLSLTKTVDNPTPSVGDLVTFTLTLANSGPSATAGVQVRDTIRPDSLVELVSVETSGTATYTDALWTVGHMPNGTTVTLRVTVRILGAGAITNTAEVVASTLPDPDSRLGNGDGGEDDLAHVTISASEMQVRSQTATGEGLEAEVLWEVPAQYTLGANYPNPLNPETVIPYAVPEAVPVQIVVYDLLGREMAVLVDREHAAGRYAVRWRAEGVATGVYLVRMQAGSFVEVRRVAVVK